MRRPKTMPGIGAGTSHTDIPFCHGQIEFDWLAASVASTTCRSMATSTCRSWVRWKSGCMQWTVAAGTIY